MMFVKDVILEFISFTDLNDTRTNLRYKVQRSWSNTSVLKQGAQHGHKKQQKYTNLTYFQKKNYKNVIVFISYVTDMVNK